MFLKITRGLLIGSKQLLFFLQVAALAAPASYHIIINHSPDYKEKDKHNLHTDLSDSNINCKNKYMQTIPSDINKIKNSNKLHKVHQYLKN